MLSSKLVTNPRELEMLLGKIKVNVNLCTEMYLAVLKHLVDL